MNAKPRWRLGLAGALLLALSGQVDARQASKPASEQDGFGRWESPLRRCQLRWPGQAGQGAGDQRSACLSLRLDQTIEGMLRVRFINAAPGSRFASEELTFAGLLLKPDPPMQCIQGRCQPSWPLRLQVHGVATRRFDARGLADQLPSNQLARGSCQLAASGLRCQAEGAAGQRWEAKAQLREPRSSAAAAAP